MSLVQDSLRKQRELHTLGYSWQVCSLFVDTHSSYCKHSVPSFLVGNAVMTIIFLQSVRTVIGSIFTNDQ